MASIIHLHFLFQTLPVLWSQKKNAFFHRETKNYHLFTPGGVLAEARGSVWESRTPSGRELKWFVCGHKPSEGSPAQGFHTLLSCFSLVCLLLIVMSDAPLSLLSSFSFTNWRSMPTVRALYPRDTACFPATSMGVHLISTRRRVPELALDESLLSSRHYTDISLNG